MNSGLMPKRKVKGLLMKVLFGIGMIINRKKTGNTKRYQLSPDIIIDGDMNLEEYGFPAKIICTPGHTLGSIMVLTNEGDLFSGDTLISMGNPSTATLIENESLLEKSLESISKLNIINIYPGHGKAFTPNQLPKIFK